MVNEFNVKRFDREKHGGYVLIFPFNKATEKLAIDLNKSASTSSNSGHCANVGGPNLMKQLI